jgi:hypothetical protein
VFDDIDLDIRTSAANVSRSDLLSHGRRAADMFIRESVPLTEAIIKVAQETSSLTPAHLERITEFANTAAFERLFEKQASDKNISFDIADPADVVRGINSAACPQTVKTSSADYALPPPAPRPNVAAMDESLEAAFAVEGGGMEKTASAETKWDDLGRNWQRACRLEELAVETYWNASGMQKQAAAEAIEKGYREILGGTNMGELIHAMAGIENGPMLKEAASAISDRLVHTLPAYRVRQIQADAINYEMQKVASVRIANHEHPVVEAFGAYVALTQKLAAIEHATNKIHDKRMQLEELVKEAGLMSAASGALKGFQRGRKTGLNLIDSARRGFEGAQKRYAHTAGKTVTKGVDKAAKGGKKAKDKGMGWGKKALLAGGITGGTGLYVANEAANTPYVPPHRT